MRPKIVALTLVLAVGLVVMAAVMKNMVAGRGGDTQPPEPQKTARTAIVASAKPESSGDPVMREQLRAAEIDKALSEINAVVADGATDPAAKSLLLDKLTNPELEVRSAALQAVIGLSDTNVIPRLEEAEQIIENPREKVAIMDAIAYLKLPSAMPDLPYTPGSNEVTANSVPDLARLRAMAGDSQRARPATSRLARRQKKLEQQGTQFPQAAPPPDGSQSQPAPTLPAPDPAPPQ